MNRDITVYCTVGSGEAREPEILQYEVDIFLHAFVHDWQILLILILAVHI